jgi:hypothetical protein
MAGRLLAFMAVQCGRTRRSVDRSQRVSMIGAMEEGAQGFFVESDGCVRSIHGVRDLGSLPVGYFGYFQVAGQRWVRGPS